MPRTGFYQNMSQCIAIEQENEAVHFHLCKLKLYFFYRGSNRSEMSICRFVRAFALNVSVDLMGVKGGQTLLVE
jgi:hypothetical protein